MQLKELIFTGFNRQVAALDRRTGLIIWQWKAAKGRSYVSLLLDGDVLIVSVDGYMYGLDALTGAEHWCNEMTGFGIGVASLASVNGSAQSINSVASAAASAASAST